ncbi:MAG: autotransporter domain-containing protein [Verrucomicrobia bacterium]|nr:autotransporter domain-containing protein [Verrucomicrobiota bacterium]
MDQRKLFLLTSLVSISSVFGIDEISSELPQTPDAITVSGQISTMNKELKLEMPLHTMSGSHFYLGNIELASGSFNTDEGATLALTGVISGSGNFVKEGRGTTLVMGSEPNTFEGKTIVSNGLLALHKAKGPAISGDILINGGTLALVTPGQIPDHATISIKDGHFDLQNNPVVLDELDVQGGSLDQVSKITLNQLKLDNQKIQGNFQILQSITFDPSQGEKGEIAGMLELPGRARTIVVPNGSLEISASIPVGGIDKHGDGSLLLSGQNSYYGPTYVRQGSLVVTGSVDRSSITVFPGAALRGSGRTSHIRNEGTVQPSGLTIKGAYTQGPLGTLHFQLRDSANYDQLIVEAGQVSLAGTALVEFMPTYSINADGKLLLIDNSKGDGIKGAFDQLQIQNIPAGYNAHLDYLANGVFLLFDPIRSDPVIKPDCYVSITPIVFASTDERLTSYTRKMTTLRNHKQEGVQLYADGIGSLGHQKRGGDAKSLHYSSGGARVGADYTNSRGVIGGAITYESTWTRHNHCASFTSNAVYGDIYGSISPLSVPEFFVEADLGGGLQFYDIHRHTSSESAKGDPNGSSYNFLVDIGYQYRGKAVYFVPAAGLEWLGAHIDHYREHHADANKLEFKKQNAEALRSNISATLGYRFSHKEWQIIPEVRGIWRHDFSRQHHHAKFEMESTETSSHFDLEGAGREQYLFGAQLMFLGRQFQLHASYDYQFTKRLRTHFLEAGIGWHF